MENNTNPPEIIYFRPRFKKKSDLMGLEQLNVRLTSLIIDWLYDLMKTNKRMHNKKTLKREDMVQVLLELLMEAGLDWSVIDSKELLKKVLKERGWR